MFPAEVYLPNQRGDGACSCSVAMLTGQEISLYLVFNPNSVKMNLAIFGCSTSNVQMMICCFRIDVIVA